MNKPSILLVEDDESLSFVIKDNLMLRGLDVIHSSDGESGWNTFKENKFDLCILDVMLPKMDGFTLAEKIREANQYIPILFLTAKSMQEDKLEGFKKGGDDYITKPFSMEELIFRIDVFLKRTGKTQNSKESFRLGNYTFNYQELTLAINNQEKHLTQKEADILKYFCQNKNRVIKREEILKEVWGNDDYFLGRSLDVFISKLRKYLALDDQVNIFNRHGVGFELIE
jgi:DNA-binding response OmpR family regulator